MLTSHLQVDHQIQTCILDTETYVEVNTVFEIQFRMAEKLTPDRRREMTRTALIDAAAELIAERGYEGASLEEIAKRAGFTRGAIYSNFEGKDDLLLAVLDRWFRGRFPELEIPDVEDGETQREAAVRIGVARSMAAFELRRSRPEFAMLSAEMRLHAIRDPKFGVRWGDYVRSRLGFVSEVLVRERSRLGVDFDSDLSFVLVGHWVMEGAVEMSLADPERADEYRKAAEAAFAVFAEIDAARATGD